MNTLSNLFVGLGVLVIVGRGPLLFAPRATLRFYASLCSTVPRVRVMGVALGVFGGVLLCFDYGRGAIAGWISIFGWLLVTLAFAVVVLPTPFCGIFQAILRPFRESLSDVLIRTLGLLAVIVGVGFVYMGLYVV